MSHLQLFPFWTLDTASDLSSGVALGELLTLLAPEYSPKVKTINSGKFRLTDFLTESLNWINTKYFRRQLEIKGEQS